MRVLGLETSCDETAAAVVADAKHVLSDVVSSQVDVHAVYGGVVPELASRHHVVNVVPVVAKALDDAGVTLDELDGIAVTRGPGLVGALLVGLQVGKTLAFARGIPLVGVHHHEGHLSAIYLEGPDPHGAPDFPHLGLLVSGGHTSLMVVEGHGRYRLMGATRDDAAGEAFDKVAKLLGLGYPGGPVIDRLAMNGNPKALVLPRPMPRRGDLEFSFSGLKTWMLTWVREHGIPTGQRLADVCASFQHAVVTSLVNKTRQAVRIAGVREAQLAGGVAANRALRAALADALAEDGVRLFVPAPSRCTDNGAMIACAGSFRLLRGERADLALNADANLPLPAP